MNAEKLMEYFKASMPNITQEKPQTEDDSFETRLQERTLQENIDFITKIGTYVFLSLQKVLFQNKTIPPDSSSKICQSKINSRSVAGPMGQMNRRPSV